MIYRILLFVQLILWGAASYGQIPVFTGTSYQIHSVVLNENRSYQVYLPESYRWAKNRRYPVLYVLDGEAHFLHTMGSVSYLAAHGEIPEMIVVAITSTIRIRDYTQSDWSSAWIGGGGANNFKHFLSQEIIPCIDSSFRTNGYRILSGHSAGGQFVLYCLASEPSPFQAYIAISPSLDWDNNLPQRSLDTSFNSMRSLHSFLYVARSDDAGRALADYTNLVETLQRKSPPGFRWFSRAFPDETHISIPLLAQIDGLRHVFTGYRFHDDSLGKGIEIAENHFRNVSNAAGYIIPVPEAVINGLGYAALDEGKIQVALALFKRNIEENPNSANAYDGLTDGYAKAGMWKEAVSSSERAVELAGQFDNPDRLYFIEHSKKMKKQLDHNSGGK